MAAAAAWQDGSETDNEASDTDSARAALPRVVVLGLRAVFDMIKETETSHPLICQRGLKSLLDVLQVKLNSYFFGSDRSSRSHNVSSSVQFKFV